MAQFAEEAAVDVGLYTGETIDTTNVAQKYQTILINLTAAYTLGYMAGIGVDFDYSLGEFRVGKSGGDKQSNQIQFFLDQANWGIQQLGKKISWFKANG